MGQSETSAEGSRGFILVTGASSGIGRATTVRLAENGYAVFAGVRSEADGAEVADGTAGSVIPLLLDVTRDDQIADAVTQVDSIAKDAGLAGLVNNAGEGFPGPMELVSVDALRTQLDVNIVGQVAVTQRFLPLIRRGRGRIVFVGSIGGKLAIEFAGPYHASKYAMEAIADCWRQELQPEGIDVVLMEPGVTASSIWDKASERVDELIGDPAAARYRERLVSFRESLQKADHDAMPADKVAEAIETSLTESRPASRYPVGISAKLAYRVRPFVPDRVFDRLARLTAGG